MICWMDASGDGGAGVSGVALAHESALLFGAIVFLIVLARMRFRRRRLEYSTDLYDRRG